MEDNLTETETTNLLKNRDRVLLALDTDIQNVMKKFSTAGSLEFPAFSSIWRSMKMSMISAGRLTKREARQFVDQCLLAAVKLFETQERFETKTGAFYIMYSFYLTQVSMPKSKIRFTVSNWTLLNSYVGEAISRKLRDVEFIFHKLCAMKAFLYVAPEIARSDLEQVEEDDEYMRQFPTQNKTALETIFTNDHIEQLSAIHKQYQEMKCILSGAENPSAYSSVNMLDVNTATEIAGFIEEFKNDPHYPGKEVIEDESSSKEAKISEDNASDSLKKDQGMEETAQANEVSEDEDNEDNHNDNYEVAEESDDEDDEDYEEDSESESD